MPKRGQTKFVITSRFVPVPGWKEDYLAGMRIFLRMLERAAQGRQAPGQGSCPKACRAAEKIGDYF